MLSGYRLGPIEYTPSNPGTALLVIPTVAARVAILPKQIRTPRWRASRPNCIKASACCETPSFETFRERSGQATPMRRLKSMVDAVNKIKERHRQDADLEAKRALNRLKTVDPARYSEFIREYERDGSREDADRATVTSCSGPSFILPLICREFSFACQRPDT
ncbi:hypothetical protein Q2941_49560 [Bradyrhizobium sp. UFLA05-153]